jgi:hypothetical protein
MCVVGHVGCDADLAQRLENGRTRPSRWNDAPNQFWQQKGPESTTSRLHRPIRWAHLSHRQAVPDHLSPG